MLMKKRKKEKEREKRERNECWNRIDLEGGKKEVGGGGGAVISIKWTSTPNT